MNGFDEMTKQTTIVIEQQELNRFLACARMCEFKTCCKKYKHGKRCGKCPKKKDK